MRRRRISEPQPHHSQSRPRPLPPSMALRLSSGRGDTSGCACPANVQPDTSRAERAPFRPFRGPLVCDAADALSQVIPRASL